MSKNNNASALNGLVLYFFTTHYYRSIFWQSHFRFCPFTITETEMILTRKHSYRFQTSSAIYCRSDFSLRNPPQKNSRSMRYFHHWRIIWFVWKPNLSLKQKWDENLSKLSNVSSCSKENTGLNTIIIIRTKID